MAISIKDADTDRLARELSEATGESITEAIRRAIEERLERQQTKARRQTLAHAVRRIQERVAALPILDRRAADEILGYDANGLPHLIMVIETSAVIAILLDEPSAPKLLAAIEQAESRKISAASVVECSLVLLSRNGEAADVLLDRLLQTLNAVVVPVDAEQVTAARDAALRYGRGRHPAALNYGDCFSYALSAVSTEPLLFVGDDFSKTDVEKVNWQATISVDDPVDG